MNFRMNRALILCVLPALAMAAGCAAPKERTRILINVFGGPAPVNYVNGFRKALDGQVLPYHSSHPDADSALLVRANKEARSISWESDPLPAGVNGDFYRIVWLAGLERAGWPGEDVHKFDFSVNGERWFTFKNLKDENAKEWRVSGKQGAELSFKAVTVDRAGDLFGYMFLKAPKGLVQPGAALRLQVTGEGGDSLDWYMTLQYSFRFAPTLRAEPALTRDGADVKQLVRLSFDNMQEGRFVEIDASGLAPIKRPLDIGANILYLPVPPVEAAADVPVTVSVNGEPAGKSTLYLKPVKWRDIYLLSYSHNDIGYTDLQPVIERKQWNNLEEALRLIQKTRDFPFEARYRWNLEVMWPLEGYLGQAPEERRNEFFQAVREGSIGLNALYANMLTGLANAPEMKQFTEYAGRFSEQYKAPITTALVSDIPGFSWGIVPALAQSGVKYFASAPNPGDRIGHVLEQWGDKPFYWKSQSGKEKVLMWVAGASYASFHEGDLSRLGDEKLLRLMRKLDEESYPYEVLQLPYTIGGDNGPPDPNLPAFVKNWNERYASPRLIIGTHSQMFADFEKRHGAGLPSFTGDFTPYWEDGAASTAAETALNRRAVDRLIQGEALWAIRDPAAYPAGDYQAAWRNAVLWDEHTWGAHNSITDPDLPSVKEQWRIKRQFALDADSMSRALLSPPGRLPAPRRQAGIPFDIFNTNSWPRTDLVLLTREQSAAGDRAVDESGTAIPSQRLSTGELAILAENVPPFSARRVFVVAGKSSLRGECRATAGTLANASLSLTLDPRRGDIQSLVWRGMKVGLADPSGGSGLNQYLYVPGKDPAQARRLSAVKVRVKESGGLVASLLVEAEAPGCRKYSAEYRMIDGLPRLDIVNRFDKLAVREKEAVHIAFPFAVPEAELRYDVASAIVRPEIDQLPGSCKNFFSIQSWVDVSNADFGVTWVSPDAPLIEIGGITAEKPWARTVRSSATIYSYVMNNYWHTNYKADQAGPAMFRYSILPHSGYRPEEAARFGRESREPLIVLPADPSARPAGSLLQVRPTAILVSSIRPLAGGCGWLLCLYNPTGTDQEATLAWNPDIAVVMRQSDGVGHPGAKLDVKLKVAAWGSAYVRVDNTTKGLSR